ncbi:MAG TPA: zinc ribbon domain-containing protein [Gemmatimonadales bacterium]|nr:zinc ribbon domain-containing protein [Gemmatimonadales bacterium]
MTVEVIAAALVGLAAVWLVLQPLVIPHIASPPVFEPLEPEETPKGVALAALKEIEFDRETGKLSDEDYAFLKEKYTGAALHALRVDSAEQAELGAVAVGEVEDMIAARVRALRSVAASTPAGAPACESCGPRPEADAAFCSSCGRRVQEGGACASCGVELGPGSRFCAQCGTSVAA